MLLLVLQRWNLRSPDHGDHPITRDHPIVDATKFPAKESQIVQSGQPVVGLVSVPQSNEVGECGPGVEGLSIFAMDQIVGEALP
jgi:hypothetical protein